MLRVQEVGDGDPVLFMHGGPSAGSPRAPMLKNMRGFRCLLVDRPGSGLSEPFPMTAENLPEFGAAFVGDVLTGLEVGRTHVVTSSFGGHLACGRPRRNRVISGARCDHRRPGRFSRGPTWT